MKKQAGFTLIELIMVIVILGILSAFALPRFADLSGNAETAAISGAEASIKSASAIVHATSLASNATDEVELEGTFISLTNGYPSVGGAGTPAGTTANGFGIIEAAGVQTDFTIQYNNANRASATTVIISNNPSEGAPCIIYTGAAANASPTINSFEGTGTNGTTGGLDAGTDTTFGTTDDTCDSTN